MAYTSANELRETVVNHPEIVEYVSVLPSGRINVKIKGENSNFFASLHDPKGKKHYSGLVEVLRRNKCSFSLLNKIENKKIEFKNGEVIRTHALKKNFAADLLGVKTGTEVAETTEVSSPETPTIVEDKDEGDCFEFDGVKYPICDIEALIREQHPLPDAGDFEEQEEFEAEVEKIETIIAKEVAVAKSYIPNASNYVPIPQTKQILACLRNNLPVYLEGHTGTGKTECLKWLAYKTQTPLIVIQGAEDMETSSLFGHIEIDSEGTFFVEGLVTLAVRNGWWCYVDEVNSIPAGVKIAMHGLLDDNKYIVLTDNKGERVYAHENFRFFSAGNPVDHGLYAGIGDENLAFLNRYQKIIVDYLPKRVERNVLTDHCEGKIDTTTIQRLVNTANMSRKIFKEGRVKGVLSTRDLKMLVSNLFYLSMDEALTMVVGKFIPDDRQAILDCFEQHFGELEQTRKLLPDS